MDNTICRTIVVLAQVFLMIEGLIACFHDQWSKAAALYALTAVISLCRIESDLNDIYGEDEE